MRFNTKKTTKVDLYEKVSNEIISSLAEGIIPWHKRWVSPHCEGDFTNFVTGRSYSAINRMCFLTQPGRYMTFKQIQDAGGKVKTGSKSRMVVFNSPFIPADKKKEAERLESEGKSTDHLKCFVLRYYNVFHEDCIEGVSGLEPMKPAERPTPAADAVIADYCRRSGVRIEETDTDAAVYSRENRTVTVPRRGQFRTEEQFYAVLFNLLAASTDMTVIKDEAKEELTHEIASCMLMNATGLDTDAATNDAKAECGRWMKLIGKNFRIAVSATSRAEKAARLILGSAA